MNRLRSCSRTDAKEIPEPLFQHIRVILLSLLEEEMEDLASGELSHA
jgi:hypothetical protein